MRSIGCTSALMAAFLFVAGCAGTGLPPTVPVKGKVVVKGGAPSDLEGGSVQFQLVSDPTIIAVGDIKGDGSFELKTWAKIGQSSPEGAVAGEHLVRVEPPSSGSDELQVTAPIPDKYRDFSKSGIRVKVPAENVEITVEKRKKK